MRTIFQAACVLLITSIVSWAAETGLYDFLDPHHPVPFTEPVGAATLRSIANDNSRYFLQLRAATNFTIPCAQIQLIVGHKTVLFDSQGQGPGGLTSMEATVNDASIVPELAKYFHTEPINRFHPGHRMLVTFAPDRTNYTEHGPIPVTFKIVNVGDVSFTFWNGGFTRMAKRDNQFSFTATDAFSKIIADTGDPTHYGGMADSVTLDSGKTFERSIDLSKWFQFDKDGPYNIQGCYYMRFADLQNNLFDCWEDFACAKFQVTIIKR